LPPIFALIGFDEKNAPSEGEEINRIEVMGFQPIINGFAGGLRGGAKENIEAGKNKKRSTPRWLKTIRGRSRPLWYALLG
jgi:hypothetical protein